MFSAWKAVRRIGVLALLVCACGSGCAVPSPAPMSRQDAAATSTEPVSLSAVHEEWSRQVADILRTLDAKGKADEARDRLLALKVAPQDRDVHLALALALEKIAEGKRGASEALAQARAWFARAGGL